jgi:hypothetical protein
MVLPAYAAVIELEPSASVAMALLHVPELSEQDPTWLDPFMKVTAPVAGEGDTFAVKVTLLP